MCMRRNSRAERLSRTEERLGATKARPVEKHMLGDKDGDEDAFILITPHSTVCEEKYQQPLQSRIPDFMHRRGLNLRRR